jgi:hypothetical protein
MPISVAVLLKEDPDGNKVELWEPMIFDEKNKA